MGSDIWHILTGEYPPQTGGVSDYTAQIAGELARRGAQVQVWTGDCAEAAPETPGVKVNRVAGAWRRRDLGRLTEELSCFAAPRCLLVQYAPNAWGRKGLNFAFCNWLLERRKLGDDVRLMVHEPFYPWRLRDKPTRWLLAAGQRRMMRTLLTASNKVYVAIPAWADMIRPFDNVKDREMVWLPICNTIPVVAELYKVDTLRQWFAPHGESIVGSFGGFGAGVAGLTERLFAAVLAARADTVALFIGAGSEQLLEQMARRYPALAPRLRASGILPAPDVSCHIAACDVLLQAYPDGVSSRRTSAIAGLAHGQPVVTMQGALTEPWWIETGGAKLAAAGDFEGCVRAARALLEDENSRRTQGAKGRAVYDAHLAVEHAVTRLLAT
jgi:glycosyltransferase involved in cell wall biosynthesis